MSLIKASIIVATRNRPVKLALTLSRLARQTEDAGRYEIIVVDDGSSPPAVLPGDAAADNPRLNLIRLEGVERSAARNAGAAAAQGRMLLFVDDDVIVESDFLALHLAAHEEWPDALAVGAIRLPDEALMNPFGRFREKLEMQVAPPEHGPVSRRNLCTAQNMSISRDLFHKLGGFDPAIISSEDQDFALRHTAHGGQIVYLPEAIGIHNDSALDIRSYCRRSQWGMENMRAFCRRHPEWPDNIERERINGPVRPGREPLVASARKLAKLCITARPILGSLFLAASALERLAPNSRLLDRTYRLLLGAHILRGHRRGIKQYDTARNASESMRANAAADARQQI
ncbi:MAG TPA: glycosyltransferase [Blastocatellia bacterium]|nr:glycosyltransferase [Blastocatellia bacterium]